MKNLDEYLKITLMVKSNFDMPITRTLNGTTYTLDGEWSDESGVIPALAVKQRLDQLARDEIAEEEAEHDHPEDDSHLNFHHCVYVVELDPGVLGRSEVLAANPNRNDDRPCVYVGQTGLTPEERFQKHKRGEKASRYVRDYGVKLMPELYKHLTNISWEQSKLEEHRLAEELREKGYTVTGGH